MGSSLLDCLSEHDWWWVFLLLSFGCFVEKIFFFFSRRRKINKVFTESGESPTHLMSPMSELRRLFTEDDFVFAVCDEDFDYSESKHCDITARHHRVLWRRTHTSVFA